MLPPAPVPGDDALVAVTSEGGKLLVFPVKDVPELARGKGNKLFDIPSKKFASREDFLTGMAVVPKDKSLVVRSGDRKMTIEWKDLKDYRGERAQRGSVLPRGWRTVDVLETGDDALVAVTSEGGKLLVFPVKDVPELARGKGNKLFDIPTKKFASREDFLTGMAVVPKDKSLVVRSGERKMTLSWSDLKDYRGQRAQRGSVLPRGWRTVDVLETE